MKENNHNNIKCFSYFKHEQANELFHTCLNIVKNNEEFTLVTIDDPDVLIKMIKEKDKKFYNTFFCSDDEKRAQIPRIINQHDFIGSVPTNKNIIILGWNAFAYVRKSMIRNKIEAACKEAFTKNIAIFNAHIGEESLMEIRDLNFIKNYKNLNDFKRSIYINEYENLIEKYQNHIALIEEISIYDNCDFILN